MGWIDAASRLRHETDDNHQCQVESQVHELRRSHGHCPGGRLAAGCGSDDDDKEETETPVAPAPDAGLDAGADAGLPVAPPVDPIPNPPAPTPDAGVLVDAGLDADGGVAPVPAVSFCDNVVATAAACQPDVPLSVLEDEREACEEVASFVDPSRCRSRHHRRRVFRRGEQLRGGRFCRHAQPILCRGR